MTAMQALTVVQGVGAAWQVTAVAAWLSSAVALIWVAGRFCGPLMPDLAWVATSAVQVGRRAHSAGRHHRWTHGRHRADRIQHPDSADKLDAEPEKPKPAPAKPAPAQPAPKGGAR